MPLPSIYLCHIHSFIANKSTQSENINFIFFTSFFLSFFCNSNSIHSVERAKRWLTDYPSKDYHGLNLLWRLNCTSNINILHIQTQFQKKENKKRIIIYCILCVCLCLCMFIDLILIFIECCCLLFSFFFFNESEILSVKWYHGIQYDVIIVILLFFFLIFSKQKRKIKQKKKQQTILNWDDSCASFHIQQTNHNIHNTHNRIEIKLSLWKAFAESCKCILLHE